MPEETVLQGSEVQAASSLAEMADQSAVATTGQDTDASATADANDGEHNEQGEKPQHKGGFQRRIDKLTREKADRERELEYWRNEALRTQKTEPAKAEPAQPAEAVKPNPDDFQTYEEYIEALTDWKTEQKLEARAKAEAAKAEEAQKKSEEQTRKESFNGKLEAFRKVKSDFDDVIQNPDIPVSGDMAQAILNSDKSAELMYFLGQNPAEAERIAKLTGVAAYLEMGKLEARLAGSESAVKEEAKTPPEPPVTKAPAPPKPVTKTASVVNKPFNPADPDSYGDFSNFERKMNERDAKRHG